MRWNVTVETHRENPAVDFVPSSGCVRVERVFALAAWLLGTQKG